MAYPQYQRSKGDWINFTIPDTELTVPMIQSGFGDGLYPVYWAFDKMVKSVKLLWNTLIVAKHMNNTLGV